VDAADGAANHLGADCPVQFAGPFGGHVVHGVDRALKRLARGVELGDGVVLRERPPNRLIVRVDLALGVSVGRRHVVGRGWREGVANEPAVAGDHARRDRAAAPG